MFRTPDGWTREEAGDAINLQHPENGSIRVWTKHASIAPVKQLAAERWSSLDAFVFERQDTARAVSLASGATACVIASSGQQHGADATGVLVFVILPEEIVVVGGVSPRARGVQLSAATREVVESFELGDATQRFLYAPPPDWHGRAQQEATLWYAPTFPRMRATITVSPAERRPAHGTPNHVYEAIVAADERSGFVRAQADGPHTIGSGFGLSGNAWSILGQPRGGSQMCRDIVVLADAHYVYTFILATVTKGDRDVSLPTLREMIRSARPARGLAELDLQ